MKLLYLAPFALALGCAEQAPEQAQVISAHTVSQGSQYQGSQYQGSQYQGSQYQGSQYQGSQYQGASYDGTTLTDAARLQGTALVIWTQHGNGSWEERFPDKICYWSVDRTQQTRPCEQFDPAESPLLGTSFTGTFVIGSTTIIGSITITAVSRDGSLAMHPLEGHTSAAGCPVVPKGAEGCEHPQGCRRNCDVWMYTLSLLDTTTSTPLAFCPGGGAATAVPGRYDATGKSSPDSTQFTFACENGTIAKCTRWGYRPFGSARKVCGTPYCSITYSTAAYELSNYHQACTRAATADYCSSGRSFTFAGTLVDVYDFTISNSAFGFVPRTRSSYIVGDATAFVWESTFDKHGAQKVGRMRYAELDDSPFYPNIEDPNDGGCPERFEKCNIFDFGCNWAKRRRSFGAWDVSSTVSIDSTPACAHSELILGTWLHRDCSSCTSKLSANSATRYCTLPTSTQGWDQTCVDAATSLCTTSERMTTHGECTTGRGLKKYATACTLDVCSDPAYASCCDTALGPLSFKRWTSSCVAAANTKCVTPGYRPAILDGFCEDPLEPLDPVTD
jgi:hypothetical protein